MEKGKISIVIPAYNAENTIGRLLDQFFMQTYTDLEIIVVNDGSTDNTRSVCERIKDKRVSLFNITNHGQGYARNYGLDRAHGEFVGFCDADDEIEPDMYESLIKMIVEHNADMACCGHCDVRGGKLIERRSHDKGCLNKNEALKYLVKGQTIRWSVWDKLFRSDKIGRLRFPTEKVNGEDVLFLLEFIKRNTTFYYADLGKYHYWRDNPDSFTKREWSPSRYGLTLLYKSLYETMVEYQIKDCIQETQIRYYENLLSTFIRSSRYGYKELQEKTYDLIKKEKVGIRKCKGMSTLLKFDLILCLYMPELALKINFFYK